MGDFGVDTAIEGAEGRYTAVLSRDWEIWGPNGGYILAILLRAAGAHSVHARPATLAAHLLGTAQFDEVDLETTTLRAGQRSESVRVSMRQGGRPIAEALVWTVGGDTAGPEYDRARMPDVPPPEAVPTIEELLAGDDEPAHRFWQNFEMRPVDWLTREEWESRHDLEPRSLAWFRFRPTPVFEDPYVEAARVALLLDTEGWPAAARALRPEVDGTWMAPNMDVAVTFHQPAAGAEHLLIEMVSPMSAGGLIGAQGQVWSPDGRLLGSGIQQMLMRHVPPPHRSG